MKPPGWSTKLAAAIYAGMCRAGRELDLPKSIAAAAVRNKTIKTRKKRVGGNQKINPIALQLFLLSEKEIQLGRTY